MILPTGEETWWKGQRGAHSFIAYILFQIFVLDHMNYVGEDEKFGAMAISYKREKTEIPIHIEDDGTIVQSTIQYEYRVIIRTSEVDLTIHLQKPFQIRKKP